MIEIRRAADADRVAIARLHEASIRALGPGAYTPEEVDSWAAGVHPGNYDELRHQQTSDTAADVRGVDVDDHDLGVVMGSVGFYAACGYAQTMETVYPTRGGLSIKCALMEKDL